MPITTDVTWADLRSAHDDELDELRDAYEEIQALATDEYGDDALQRPLPNDPDALDDDRRDLWVYQQQTQQYDEAAKSIQKRQHMLGRLADEYGDGAFTIQMLSGEQAMDIETELRMYAQSNDDLPMAAVELRRNALTVDAATVDAPEGVPRDGDGSPVPSECPNALTLALWEQVEAFNNAGETGFRAEGFGNDDRPAPTAAASATPTPASVPSEPSDATDDG
jgi:hypothetical protein